MASICTAAVLGALWGPEVSRAEPQAAPVAGFPAEPHPPAGAPNILIIMTDDVGFGASSTFGGPIPTPTFDDLASRGVRYNEFHNNSLCSPTRAALLTGRNAHSIGNGAVPELATGQPGYNSVTPSTAASFVKVLEEHGYSTAMFGKHHNRPEWQGVPGGPVNETANGFGFDYFYGFEGGETNQYFPTLLENNVPREPPLNDPDYILDHDLADHAVHWLQDHATQAPGRPFLLYYVPGTTHAPVQAPKEWIDHFKGKFDGGWDALRTETFERQKRLGIIPPDAKLNPMSKGTPAWAGLSADQKRVYARYMEVYAGALAYADHEIGRMIAELKAEGQLDNTLILYLQGDNGASPEGGPTGSANYVSMQNGKIPSVAESLGAIDLLGGPQTYPVIPVGWARALNTPFQWNKGYASHLGGMRTGLVISWPGHLTDLGTVRTQFHHVVDIAPTIYEITHIPPPRSVDGVEQRPLDGVSMAYTFDHPGEASRHRVQYFETFGHMGFYEDGWLLSSHPSRNFDFPPPKADAAGGKSGSALTWELYDLKTDYSQSLDLAQQRPEQVKRLAADFWKEAARNHVLPITSEMPYRVAGDVRPTLMDKPGRYTFYNSPERYSDPAFPNIINRSWSLEADLTVPASPPSGALVSQGGRFAGWGLFVFNGVPTFLYRADETAAGLTRLAAPAALGVGDHRLGLDFKSDGDGVGRGGTVSLSVDGQVVAQTRLERTVSYRWAAEGATIGRDRGTPVSNDYAIPFIYPGEIAKVTVQTGKNLFTTPAPAD